MRELDKQIIEIRNDRNALEEFIISQEGFIIKTATRITKRFVSKSDDEWSIALSAYLEAIEKYDIEKGSFVPFAEMIIRSRLIDWFRANGKFSPEVHIEDNQEKGIIQDDAENLRLEIEALGDTLREYGFSFLDIVKHSPKAEKTKMACKVVTNYIIDNPIILTELQSSLLLPIKIIEKNSGVPRKTIERHRKYIIVAVEILVGDYPYLSEYLRYIRGGAK